MRIDGRTTHVCRHHNGAPVLAGDGTDRRVTPIGVRQLRRLSWVRFRPGAAS